MSVWVRFLVLRLDRPLITFRAAFVMVEANVETAPDFFFFLEMSGVLISLTDVSAVAIEGGAEDRESWSMVDEAIAESSVAVESIVRVASFVFLLFFLARLNVATTGVLVVASQVYDGGVVLVSQFEARRAFECEMTSSTIWQDKVDIPEWLSAFFL